MAGDREGEDGGARGGGGRGGGEALLDDSADEVGRRRHRRRRRYGSGGGGRRRGVEGPLHDLAARGVCARLMLPIRPVFHWRPIVRSSASVGGFKGRSRGGNEGIRCGGFSFCLQIDRPMSCPRVTDSFIFLEIKEVMAMV